MQIRLALREEGSFWNAYLACSDTMDGAQLIGSVIIGAVKKNPEAKTAFKALMEQILADAIEQVTGERPDGFATMPAPESERAGHG